MKRLVRHFLSFRFIRRRYPSTKSTNPVSSITSDTPLIRTISTRTDGTVTSRSYHSRSSSLQSRSTVSHSSASSASDAPVPRSHTSRASFHSASFTSFRDEFKPRKLKRSSSLPNLNRTDHYTAEKRFTISSARTFGIDHAFNQTTDVDIIENAVLRELGLQFKAMKRDKRGGKEWNKHFPPDSIVIYTDGSCVDQRMSGFGIYHGPEHELNRAVRIDGPVHNSGLAEILAVHRALNDLLDWENYKNQVVIIRTDYLPLIARMLKVDETDYTKSFPFEYDLLKRAVARFPPGVKFEHVYSHDGDPGNEAADELARQASMSTATSSRRARSASRERSRERRTGRGRSASRNNDRAHIRSHSVHVRGRTAK